jgi:hypothetical protein
MWKARCADCRRIHPASHHRLLKKGLLIFSEPIPTRATGKTRGVDETGTTLSRTGCVVVSGACEPDPAWRQPGKPTLHQGAGKSPAPTRPRLRPCITTIPLPPISLPARETGPESRWVHLLFRRSLRPISGLATRSNDVFGVSDPVWQQFPPPNSHKRPRLHPRSNWTNWVDGRARTRARLLPWTHRTSFPV